MESSSLGEKRETLASRLGFLMLSVGCAVGLGNVWRFPFIVGKFGGGMFVLLYLFFLVLLGWPVLLMELSVGRASRSNLMGAFGRLARRARPWWVRLAKLAFCGNVLLMMYYTTVSGWLFAYTWHSASGRLAECAGREEVGDFFVGLVGSPWQGLAWMLLVTAAGALLCSGSLRDTVEKSVKYMMALLFLLMGALAVRALFLPGAAEGLRFYLLPNWNHFSENFLETVFAAMGQAFFTLSLGVGAMEIFGSYLGWKKPLAAEGAAIVGMDTLVAFTAGLIIFPVCATYGVAVDSGPGLLFVSLPNAFNHLAHGRLYGALFFVFMALAALTTVVTVFEHIIAVLMEECGLKRPAAALATGLGIAALSVPCVLGFSIWGSFHPFGGTSTILDLEDFFVSNNLLPLGALVCTVFCTQEFGWGMQGFKAELEAGQRRRFPAAFYWYCRWVLPLIILAVFVMGYWKFFS